MSHMSDTNGDALKDCPTAIGLFIFTQIIVGQFAITARLESPKVLK
jgi:hypothetical protein